MDILSPEVWRVVIIGGYLLLLLALGLGASRLFTGSSEDYLLASHSIGPFLLLMSLFGTTMTGFALVGSSGEAFTYGVGVYGLLASSSGIVHSLCFFVLGVKLWGWGKKYGYTTQAGFFRDRLDSRNIGLVLVPILVGLVIPYLLVGVIAGGKAIEGATAGDFPQLFESTKGAIPAWLTELVVCAVVLTYVFAGGMRGTAWANAFQTCVFMVLGVVAFYLIATSMAETAVAEGRVQIPDTDGEIRTEAPRGFLDSLQIVSREIPKAKRIRDEVGPGDQLGNVESPEIFRTRERLDPWRFATYMFIPFSVGMFPHLFQHWLTAKSASTFKLPVVVHPFFIAVVWVPCVLIGAWATTGLVDLPPPWLASDVSVEENANKVLGFMVSKLSGKILGGFLLAGVLAAIMSSLDSQFLCIGTMFTKDLVEFYAPAGKYTDRQTVLMSRGFIIAVVAVTYVLSLLMGDSTRVFPLGIWCFSGFASLFPIAFLAVYWRGFTKWGCYAGVLAAAGSWGALFYASDFAANGEYYLNLAIPGYRTVELMPVTAMFLASGLAAVIVSLVTPKPSAATLAKFFPEKA
ncbi:sodium:solute symporter family protein [Alienimonas chondri]|uniref:Sodium/proline symporter n=1 Tax=Alienimonas chondri TaxID=2681879 RepID=A0ABX1VGN5_9PLAN|nr:sodium:solute symporter family protein [Alienimonas chondri]NNJ26438.1 Sodium/proline symporter [Alienimonas chondri]